MGAPYINQMNVESKNLIVECDSEHVNEITLDSGSITGWDKRICPALNPQMSTHH